MKKQKLEKNFLEIATDDLAFNNNEIESLVRGMGQTTFNSKLAEIISKTTEGWIAGILILCQATKSIGTNVTTIESTKLEHEDALFRYMSQEVLRSIEDDTQDALAKLSLLQDFSEEEASEIFKLFHIESMMDHCIGFGMFIQRIPGIPVVYRFHSLCREFLLYVLRGRYSDEKISEFHLKAAGYYISNGTYGRAAEHLAKCKDYDLALDMVTKVGFNKFLVGETGQLKVWLDLLPEDMVMKNPILLMFKAQLMPNSRQLEMIGPLKHILHLALLENSAESYYNVASILIYIYMCSNDMDGLLDMTTNIPWLQQNVSRELSNTLAILDMVRSMSIEQFVVAEEQSDSILCALLPEDSQWLYLILCSINYYCIGKLDHAERCMRTALVLDHYKNIEPARGFVLLFLSIALTLKNEKEQLPSYISEILEIGQKYQYEFLTANGKRLSAFERYLSLDVEGSVEMLDYAIYYYHQMGNKAMAAACKLLHDLWTLQLKSPKPDLDEVQKNIITIKEAYPGLMVYESSLSILGAISRELGNFDQAENYLLESIKLAEKKKAYQVLCGAFFHLASLYYATEETEKGHQYLNLAMELAACKKYFMFWDIHIPTLVEMVLRGIRYGYCIHYAEEMLCKFYNIKTVKYLSEKIKSIDEGQITAFINDFISTYKTTPSEKLYFVKATLFGKPELSVNGIKIPDTEWKTKKVKGFLEYLLLNSGITISKDNLAEILWPDSDGKSAIASQRTALYYLRKVLSKYNAEVSGTHAFIYETLEGLQIRTNETLELDIHEFMSLYKEWTQFTSPITQADQRQIDILLKMISLYRGDLMEGSDYGDLVIYERERLKSIFMEVCQNLSLFYIRCGKLVQAEEILRRALVEEPYDETICLELLKLYKTQGKRSKAVKLYYCFKNRFEQELGIKIDKKLTETIHNY